MSPRVKKVVQKQSDSSSGHLHKHQPVCSENSEDWHASYYSIARSDVKVPLIDQSCLTENMENCVELINIGSVKFGEPWDNKLGIFPIGFRSRVRFFSVLNPTKMCWYTSEVKDGGFLGPVFKVVLEHYPSETFSDSSPQECWEQVLRKLHLKIRLDFAKNGFGKHWFRRRGQQRKRRKAKAIGSRPARG